ncbi:uncharacterized protein EI90DRAFT_3145723 [Cantharellus anzutake]|uniref:uncharacterized protein n=1 Tax=Cantharellus anzutake TaxID=1750568 RepID=UPI001905D950|nr:uncharacterized protein EI90DRAFT_3145723 [Cantharellus anzutake]KAF8330829.1 hypothetical protein EI90DRAFT_3145723 [Cantharellus anzutake]
MPLLTFLVALSIFPIILPTLAQDGSVDGPSTSTEAAGYSCDPSKCQLPTCRCASTDIPGGIPHDQTPQFIVFTADDAIQSYTINAVNNLLAHRKNPNGCTPKMTYFTQISYTNFTLVTDWFVAGNEIADHTMTHPELGGPDEINGNLVTLNALAGIPLKDIRGFRAPYLNYSSEMLGNLVKAGFTYDSSATASIPVNQNGTDAFWPYTLDNGLANDCLTIPGICKGQPKLPGFWEVLMYAIFDERGGVGTHLMDPWIDGNNSAVYKWMQNTFVAHYNANRQPFGLYTHPIHIATGYPGVADPTDTINMINSFLDWAQQQSNVWIVSTGQLLDWVMNPVPASQLNSIQSFQCALPVVEAKICNGIPSNEAGLLSHCAFTDFPFYTCYGCPATQPSPSDPNPSQPAVSGKTRTRLPSDCYTAFWDPINGTCLCQNGTSCQFTDQTRPIGPNGANLTGGGTGGGPTSSPSYVPFNGGSGGALSNVHLGANVLLSVGLGLVGVAFGVLSTMLAA